MDDGQRNKSHKASKTGNKAVRKDEIRKKKAGIDLQPNRGANVRAFTGVTAGSRKAQQQLRSMEKRETVLHVPAMDKTLRHIIAEPPLLVVVAGPPQSGKTTLIRSMLRFYSGRNIRHLNGPATVITGRSRRITFMECPNTLTAMCDLAKVADLVLLMVDGSYGFEMETFEFLNIAQVHGFPKMFGIVSHLDKLRTGKALKKRKKFLRHRFWHEVAQGAKLLCLAPMLQGMYRSNDVLKLHRMLICVEPKIQNWRNTHSCILVDRHEDITEPDAVAQNPTCSRTVAFYGYVRGKPMKPNQLVHLVGVGDYPLAHLSRQDDPCQFSDMNGSNNKEGSQGHKMRHLNKKQKRLYAPYCDVGGITYDDDAIYVQEDAESMAIERSGEGLNLLRQLQRAQPVDGQSTQLDVVRRPVNFEDEDTMELAMDPVEVPQSSDSDSESDADDEALQRSRTRSGIANANGNTAADLREFGLGPRESDDEAAGEGKEGDAPMAPRMPDDPDSIRVKVTVHNWSENPKYLRLLKNLCVTGDWNANEDVDGDGDDPRSDVSSKGYDSEDEEFQSLIRGTSSGNKVRGTQAQLDEDDASGGSRSDEDLGDGPSSSMGPSKRSAVDALASVKNAGSRSAVGRDSAWGAFLADDGCGGGQKSSAPKRSAKDDDEYDILRDDAGPTGKSGNPYESATGDDELNGLVAHFLAPSSGKRGQTASNTAAFESLKGDNEISFYDAEARHKRTVAAEDQAEMDESNAVTSGQALTEEQEELMKKRMAKKKAYDEDYDLGGGNAADAGGKSNTLAYYHHLNREVEEKKGRLDAALEEMGDDVDKKVQLVGYFSGLYVRFVVENVPVEFLTNFDARQPLIAGGVNMGEDQYNIVHAKIKRHRWFPKILKAQDPLLISMGWRRFQTQPIFATEDPNGRVRYLKYTPMHMHCVAAFYAPVTPTNTGFLAIPVNEVRTPGFRISCTGYTVANDSTTTIVKKLKLTGTPQKIQKTTAFIKGMFTSDVEAAKFVGAKLKAVSGIRGIIKAVLKGKSGLVRATFEDKIFPSDIVFIRAWKPVDPPRFCVAHRNLVDPEWKGMRPMRELRLAYNKPLQLNPDSEYKEITRRHRVADDDEGGRSERVLLSRNMRMNLPFDMKEDFIPLAKTSERQTRLAAAVTVAPEPRETRRAALLDMFADKASEMSKQKREAKKRARTRQQQATAEDRLEYTRKLKEAKKETARKVEFRSQHKSRK